MTWVRVIKRKHKIGNVKMRVLVFLLCMIPFVAVAQTTGTITGGTITGNNITGITTMDTPSLSSTDNSSAAIYSSWVRQFFPGLGANIQGTGLPGLDVSSCTTSATCGTMYYTAPANLTAASTPLLRLQRSATYSGGTPGNTVQSLWVLTTTSPNGAFYEWPITSQMNNQTAATTGAQNVAINGTANKQYPSGSTSEIGPTWAANFACNDMTGLVNPSNSCIGAELDDSTIAGAGTDVNKERVALQINEGPRSNDTSVHFGRAILIGASNGGVIDNALEVDTSNNTNTFLVNGNGSTTINSPNGSWSSYNAGKKLVITTPINTTNPTIGISDTDNTNFWGITNYSGILRISTMPSLTNSSAPPVFAVSFPPNGVGGIQLPVTYVNHLPTCNSGAEGTLLAVYDSSTVIFNAPLSGGGTNHVMAYCTGSAWTVH